MLLISGRGIFLGLLVLAVIVALFFIPEIIEFQKGTGSSTREARVEVTRDDEPQDEVELVQSREKIAGVKGDVEAPSALDELAMMLDYKKSGGDDSTTRASLASKAVSTKDRAEKTSITWDKIRGGQSKDALKSSKKISLEIARTIPPTATTSRYALYNLASGIDLIFGRGNESMSATEAQRYLISQKEGVNKAIYREVTDRGVHRRWQQVWLGPVVERERGGDKPIQFNPRLTLTNIKVRQMEDRNRNPNPNSEVIVTLGGYMMGDDIKRLDLIRGDGMRSKRLGMRKDKRGYRFFSGITLDGRYDWTFRVSDKYGSVVDKHYSFYPRIRAFPYAKRKYLLPYRNVASHPRLFIPQYVDPRIDLYFRKGGALFENSWNQTSDGQQLFSNF